MVNVVEGEGILAAWIRQIVIKRRSNSSSVKIVGAVDPEIRIHIINNNRNLILEQYVLVNFLDFPVNWNYVFY